MAAASEGSIKRLIQKYHDSPFETLLPEELNVLIDASLPSQVTSIRAQSLVFLAKFSSNIRQKYSSQPDHDAATSLIVRTFSAPIEAHLADSQESTSLSAISFLITLFQVDWTSTCVIFSRDGLLDSIMETLDLYPTSETIPVAVASLLSHASGYKECRSLISTPQVTTWLDKSTKQTKDSKLRGAAAVALVKLSQGSEIDAQSSSFGGISVASSRKPSQTGMDDNLVELLKDLVVTEARPSSSTLDAVEGLAYLTVRPSVKENLSSDPTFLKRLLALVPRRPNATSFPASHADRNVGPTTVPDLDAGLSYGIALIIANICSYKRRLSEEEQQIDRLRRITKEPGAGGKLSANTTEISDTDKVEEDDRVQIRGKRLMDSGVVDALSSIIKRIGEAEKRSVSVQRTVARAFLNLVEDKTNRGGILQGGGARTLLTTIRTSIGDMDFSGTDTQKGIDTLNSADLLAIQALAKLSITASPAAVYGPAQDSYVDAIRPLAILLLHSSAKLLQRFEAVMALTNIASVTPEAAERVSAFRLEAGSSQNQNTSVGNIVKCAETHLLDGNVMLRRASAELVCNLVGGAEDSFNYFGGAMSPSGKSRLQILVALSDVEDLPTRLAASGALATLTASHHACQNLVRLEMERHRVLPVLVDLISPEIAREYREERPGDDDMDNISVGGPSGDPGLVHRGVVCIHNIFANLDSEKERKPMSLEAEKRGLVRALVQIIKSNSGGPANEAILRPAGEVLKWILQSGVKLPL